MKKALIAIVIAVVVIGGGYLIFHKSPAKSSTSSSSSKTATNSNAPAVNNAVLLTKTDASVGQYLADPSGRALYTYGADSSGVSNCTGSCLASWPAYVDKGSTSNLPTGVGTIKRSDNGQVQYTYNGMPLYYFASDSPGQVTGNGVDNFQIAKPSSQTQSTSTPATTPSTPAPAASTNSSSSSGSGYPY